MVASSRHVLQVVDLKAGTNSLRSIERAVSGRFVEMVQSKAMQSELSEKDR